MLGFGIIRKLFFLALLVFGTWTRSRFCNWDCEIAEVCLDGLSLNLSAKLTLEWEVAFSDLVVEGTKQTKNELIRKLHLSECGIA